MAISVVCVQLNDGEQRAPPLVIPPLEDETAAQTLARKLLGAQQHGWEVISLATSFHAWKLYTDGDDTPDNPHRKDRYFSLEERP